MKTIGLEKTEKEILAFDVSDEALEIAAGTAKKRRRASPLDLAPACPCATANRLLDWS